MSNNPKALSIFYHFSFLARWLDGWMCYINRLAQTHSQPQPASQPASAVIFQLLGENTWNDPSARRRRDRWLRRYSHRRRQDVILVPLAESLFFSFFLFPFCYMATELFSMGQKPQPDEQQQIRRRKETDWCLQLARSRYSRSDAVRTTTTVYNIMLLFARGQK